MLEKIHSEAAPTPGRRRSRRGSEPDFPLSAPARLFDEPEHRLTQGNADGVRLQLPTWHTGPRLRECGGAPPVDLRCQPARVKQ
jgi:hypothetical protein